MPARKSMSSTAASRSKVQEPKATVVTEKEVIKKEAEPKKFKATDEIKCTSITAGGLYMIGKKTDTLYTWLDAGDSVYVSYADLAAEVRTKGMYAFRPRFVVDDQDFINEFPELDTLYASLYSKNDLRKVLELEPNQMRTVINGMPDGAKESLKSLAVTAIENGTLDSINRIKVIDDIFGTSMLLKMTV